MFTHNFVDCIVPKRKLNRFIYYDTIFYCTCVKVSLTVVILICDWGNNITRESGLTGQEKGKKGENTVQRENSKKKKLLDSLVTFQKQIVTLIHSRFGTFRGQLL